MNNQHIKHNLVKIITIASIILPTVLLQSQSSQAIPLDGILDNAGKSFVRGMFNIPPERPTPRRRVFRRSNNYSQPSYPSQNNYADASDPNPPPLRFRPRIAEGRLLQVSCVKADGNDLRAIGRDDSESMISVGRRAMRVYAKTSTSAYSGSYGETCSIQAHPSSEKVSIAFALPDSPNNTNVRVSIYVDGQEKISNIMSTGQFRRYNINIAGANSYAYTLQPIEGGSDIYFPYIAQPR